MWSVALRVGGCGRGGGWFVVLWRTFAAFRRSSGRHKWRPYVCVGWFAVFRRLVCGVARGGAIHDARCRNGTCGRSRCVSVDAGGASVDCCFASVIWASQVAPLRLRAVECCFSWRSSGRHGWRPYVCGWLIVVLRVVVGGVTRGLSGEGDGYEKRSRTDVAVSVWLLVVAEARLERTTSRL